MNVLFIYPDITGYAFYKGIFYSGIASISTALKSRTNSRISLMHLTRPLEKKEFIRRLISFRPELVAFSTTTNSYVFVKEWAGWVKEADEKIIVACGGVHPTLSPEEVIANENIDIICRGEGEDALTELCVTLENGKSFRSIENLWVKDGKGIQRNRMRPLIGSLDELGFPDRTIFDYPNLHYESMGEASVMFSRGCPYGCAYCCNDALKRLYAGNGSGYVRFRSTASAINELKQILHDYPFIKSFSFDDDILPLDKSWFRDFAVRYKESVNLPYTCNLRPNLMDEEIAGLLKSSGCREVHMGIECGDENLRNKVLARNLTNDTLRRAYALCNKYGLNTYSFNILGLPGEDKEMMLKTLRLNAEIADGANQATIFYPYKETPLYKHCEEKGLIGASLEMANYSKGTVLNFDRITRNRLIFTQRYFPVLVKYYKLIKKYPSVYPVLRYILERIILSDFSSFFVLPLLSATFERLMQSRHLSLALRSLKRGFIAT